MRENSVVSSVVVGEAGPPSPEKHGCRPDFLAQLHDLAPNLDIGIQKVWPCKTDGLGLPTICFRPMELLCKGIYLQNVLKCFEGMIVMSCFWNASTMSKACQN